MTKRHYDRKYKHVHTVILLNMYKNSENMYYNKTHKSDVEAQIKSLAAWSISERRVDQKQILNFVRPLHELLLRLHIYNLKHTLLF